MRGLWIGGYVVGAAVLLACAVAAPAHAGSICRDGTWSASEGSGTCSHHGGVAQSGVPEPGDRSVIGGGSAPSPTSGTNQDGGGYSRTKFRHWITQPGGCTTREVVLIDERIDGTVAGCRVVQGKWYSAYDGKVVINPRALDIDHFVPLKEAWISGASSWSAQKRQAYANDLGWAGSLIAVTASTNRSKSDRDPAEWLPPRAGERCTYVYTWVAVKMRWGLSMDPQERKAIDQVIATCPAQTFEMPGRAYRSKFKLDNASFDSLALAQ